ncbi:MAG: RloB domain-containing protein [Magnetococcales bacterium]|nr:RloB domain-containing protein [Magnetococcales bacterium]
MPKSLTSRKRLKGRTGSSTRDSRLFVIATEGSETEPLYFNCFKEKFTNGNRKIKIAILGAGGKQRSSPKQILGRIDTYIQKNDIKKDDEFWLVLDAESRGGNDLDSIATEAKRKKYRLAISNPSFEIWLLCHRQRPPGGPVEQRHLEDSLSKALGKSYEKGKITCDDYMNAVDKAIAIAKKSDLCPDAAWPKSTGTHVYRVIESIKAFINATTASI